MRKHPRCGWLILTVALALGLGLVPPLTVPAGAAGGVIAPPLPGDRDGDGVGDVTDECPDTFGTTDETDGFVGCWPIKQVVSLVSKGGTVEGRVVPQEKWREQDVCRSGIEVTLRARWYTDHDPGTLEGALTEATTTDANGSFDFDADLPLGTEYSVEAYPRAVVGDEVYCASARTAVISYYEEVAREVVASYTSATGKVTGEVDVPGPTKVRNACSDLQTARLMLASPNAPGVEVGSTTFLGSDKTFSIDVGELVDGAHYYVLVAERSFEGFPDLCREARVDVTVMTDQDDDGVGDAADACPEVPGPVDGDVPGCVVVERQLTADYDGSKVSGELTIVSLPPGTGNPCELPMVVQVWMLDAQETRALVASGSTGGGADQAYSIPVEHLPDATRYVVTTAQVDQTDIALCGAAKSTIKVSDDRDDDDVPDGVDACREVAGGLPSGCPTVTRSVTASYRAGQLVGKVSVTSLGGAPTGACSAPARLQVWLIEPYGARRELGGPVSSLADGSYAIPRALDVGTTVKVQALAGEDPGRALCGAADSRTVLAYEQRPVVQRTVVASYAVGNVSGTARPVGSGVPAGACSGAPVVVTYAGAGGVPVRFDGLVGPEGTFEVGVGRPPVGTSLTVTLDAYDDDVAVCPAVQPSTSVTVLSDRDDDGVPDTTDACPGVAGPTRLLESGCPVVQRRLVTSYADGVLSGSVALVDAAASPPEACSARSFVQVSSFEGDEFKDNLWSGWTDPDGTFAAPVGRLAHGTGFYAVADPYLDPDAGICQTADATQVFQDRDGDSFDDSADKCPDVAGPAVGTPGFSEAFRGCRLVETEVSVAYADLAVSGRVRPADPENAPAGACSAPAEVRVTRLASGELESGELGRGETTAPSGTYSIPVGHLPIGTRLRVTASFPHVVVDQISACGQSRSEIVEITDGDGDAVADYLDECPGVPAGQGSTLRPGCPTVARQVTATYADGAVSGDAVPVGSANAPAGACAPAAVDVYRVNPDGRPATLLASDATDATGGFHVVLDEPLEGGTRFQVVSASFSDRDVADCALASSAEVGVARADQDGDGVPDGDDLCDGVPAPQGYLGCPKVARSVTSRYDASGAVTGRVRLVNPEVAPGACLQATVEVLRVDPAGVPRIIGSRTTEPDGSFSVLPAQPLVGGDVYFALVSSTSDRELAFCAGGQSGARVVPAPKLTS